MINKLNEIDSLIESAKTFSSTDLFLSKLALLVFEYLEIELKPECNAIFIREIEFSKKRFIGYCLLRVYSINPTLLTNISVKHNVHKLIESVLPEVYAISNLNGKSETYEIENRLNNFTKNIEKQISQNLNSKFDLDLIQVYENNYRSSLNKNSSKHLLETFWGDTIERQSIDNAFKLLRSYTDCELNEKYDRYNKSLNILDSIIDSVNEVNTKYSIEYILNPFKKIRETLKVDFESNPFSKSAKLTVQKTIKKYPFSPGIDYKIQFQILNESTGYANDVQIKITLYSDDIIQLKNQEQFVGVVKTSSLVEFNYKGLINSDNILIYGQITWVNFNGEENSSDFEIILDGQKNNIDWEDIEKEEPYDLEPVTEENNFIGRKKIILDLKKIRKKVSSSYIFGQRRVGKTSIVKTLQSIASSSEMLFIYIEAGDWESAGNPNQSLNDLGTRICNKIKRHSQKFKSIELPKFEGSLNRITEFLDEVSEIESSLKVVIILDEFDRISRDLLYESEIAKSFILTIRSISNREQYGFILVGGEKLEYILSQWQEFNKFNPYRVDYFDKETEWEDFKTLIKYPLNGLMEISDKAIDYIYAQTSGNPYFTKKICSELFSLMVLNRDSHITVDEAIMATAIARDSNNIAATDFSHFWKDGIREKEEEEISVNRRKVLLSLGQIINKNQNTGKQLVIDQSMLNGLSELQAEKTLAEFVQRKILKIEDNNYRFVVKFFEDWLVSNGLEKIITTFQEEQRVLLRQKYEEQLRVKHEEINQVAKSWSVFKGKEITSDIIREWLEQFDGVENQRLMFKILEHLKFYTNNEVREKMEALFREVKKEIRKEEKERFIKENQKKRDDILVSYLDQNPAKSGAEYAKIFVEANNIYKDNSIVITRLERKLNENKNLNALVFIDDFIGSGNSIIENLKELVLNYQELILERKLIVIIGVITGYLDGKHSIEEYAKNLNFPVRIKILDPLDNSNRCFDNDSIIYLKPFEREKAKRICYDTGLSLEKRHPLGYEDCQATIVFPNTCPNNTLPILWKKKGDWKPIFERG